MEKRDFHDLTRGTPWKVLLLFSLPIFLGNVLGQVYSQLDNIMVGRVLGDTAFGALGAAGSITYLGTVFACNFPAGASAFTAHLFGKKDYEGLRKSFVTSLFLAVIIGAIISVIMALMVPLFCKIINIEEGTELYTYISLYSYVVFGGLICPFLFNTFLNFFRSIGDSTTSLWLAIIYALINILTDYLFIVVFKWGLVGAASSNLVANTLSSVVAYVWLYLKYPQFRPTKADCHLDKKFVSSHLRLGLPFALQFSILAIGVIYMQGAVDAYGIDAINGFNVASKIENFLCCFVTAFGSAVAAYCGQNYGAKKFHRVKRGINASMIILLIDCALVIGLTALVKEPACSFFLSDPNSETIRYCSIYCNWDMVCYVFLFAIFLFRNVNEGIDKPSVPFIGGISELISRLSMSLGFVHIYGEVAALGASAIAWFSCGIVNAIGTIRYVYLDPKYNHDEDEDKTLVKA